MNAASMLALLGMAAMQGFLSKPPQDLASLLPPLPTLEQLQVTTNEDSLLAVLSPVEAAARATPAQLEEALQDLGGNPPARRRGQQVLRAAREHARALLEKAVGSDDPEVRLTAKQMLAELNQQRHQIGPYKNTNTYLTQLMAIRALQGMKSARAVPELQRLAAGGNPTLADAATNAILIIQGKEPLRPRGGEVLKQVMTHLPADIGFVVVGDLERASQVRSLQSWSPEIVKLAESEPSWRAMVRQPAGMIPEIENGLLQGIGRFGNLRIDAFALMISQEIGVDQKAGYLACLVKGLHDPDMVTKEIRRLQPEVREFTYRKHSVLASRDLFYCSPDKHTFVIVFSEAENEQGVRAVLDGLAGAPKAETAKHLRPAFDLVIAGKARVALAGALSMAQKEILAGAIGRERTQIEQMQELSRNLDAVAAAMDLASEQCKVKSYVAHVTEANALLVDGTCADAATSTVLADKAGKLEQRLRDKMVAAAAQMKAQSDREGFGRGLDKMDLTKPLFEAKAAGGQIILTVPLLHGQLLCTLPWVMLL